MYRLIGWGRRYVRSPGTSVLGFLILEQPPRVCVVEGDLVAAGQVLLDGIPCPTSSPFVCATLVDLPRLFLTKSSHALQGYRSSTYPNIRRQTHLMDLCSGHGFHYNDFSPSFINVALSLTGSCKASRVCRHPGPYGCKSVAVMVLDGYVLEYIRCLAPRASIFFKFVQRCRRVPPGREILYRAGRCPLRTPLRLAFLRN